MPPVGPVNDLKEFIAACGRPHEVKVLQTAADGAISIGLKFEDEILDWIADGAIYLEEFQNSEPWRNNRDNSVVIMVDAYNFYNYFDTSEYLYIAFMYQPKTSKWLIKSLKRNDKDPPRAFALADQLKAAGLV